MKKLYPNVCFGLAALLVAGGCGGKTQQQNGRLTWAGVATGGQTSIALQFKFADDILSGSVSVGAISGVLEFRDPISGQLVQVGPVNGNRNGAMATWATASGLTVAGTISGDTFLGDGLFPGALSYPDLKTTVHLTRQSP